MNRTPSIPGWYMKFLASVLEQLPRPREMDQATAEGWIQNQKALKNVLAENLLPPKKNVDKCKLDFYFKFNIPYPYDHKSQLTNFYSLVKEGLLGDCNFDNWLLTDDNYRLASHRIEAGKVYEIKFFKIEQPMSSNQCLQYLAKQKATLVGAQGLSLLLQWTKGNLPKDGAIVSFDKKKCLPFLCERRAVPKAYFDANRNCWEFNGSFFEEEDWGGCYLLGFCEVGD